MLFNIISIFPDMFKSISDFGITSKALKNNLFALNIYNPRDFTIDKYRRIDESPCGGGAGMVMQAQPLYDALMQIQDNITQTSKNLRILPSPQGISFSHQIAKNWLRDYDSLTFICGRYEGIDQRFIDSYIDIQVSIGDVVVSGGELPCMLMLDAMIRLIPQAINQDSVINDSFENNLLDYPHYTKPVTWQNMPVPDVLLSGHHKNIAKWRYEQALQNTKDKRPDLLIGE